MKKFALLALSIAAVSAQAQVFATGPFATPVAFQEDFDSVAAGTYNALSVFSTPAVMQRIGTALARA